MIRKTAFLVTGTVTGLVAVLSYNPPKLANAIAASGSTSAPATTDNTSSASNNTQNSTSSSSSNTSSSTKSNTPVQPSATKSSSNSSTSSAATSSTTTESPAPTPTPTQKQSTGSSGTYKGETVQTRWGPVQVQIVVSNGKITDISTLQYPNGDRRSQMISSQVIPWLQQEALQAQSANISGIGGATYTSGGFINSLASALQKAGI